MGERKTGKQVLRREGRERGIGNTIKKWLERDSKERERGQKQVGKKHAWPALI